MKILIIEDERELAQNILSYLVSESYVCEIAANYYSAMEKTGLYTYDCILLDLMLPGGDGLKILDSIKQQNKHEGIIIISAKDSLSDKITGLQAGADDYLAKPFHLAELSARIFSVIRRKQFADTNTLEQHELLIDILSKSVSVSGVDVLLTKKEFDLLLFFMSNKNKVLSKSAVAEHLSGDVADMFDNYDFVYAHVKNLKRKLQAAGSANYLKNIYGTGYKWTV